MKQTLIQLSEKYGFEKRSEKPLVYQKKLKGLSRTHTIALQYSNVMKSTEVVIEGSDKRRLGVNLGYYGCENLTILLEVLMYGQ